MEAINEDATFKIKGWEGIAFRFGHYEKVWEPWLTLGTDEDGNEVEIEEGEGEWVEDKLTGQVYMIMVGDDHPHLVDVSDMVEIDEEDYCGGCGQIGCGWG